MKKNEIKRNIITLTLTIIMLVSIALPAFAYGANEIIKNFETDNGDIVESYYYPSVKDELSATIKSDSVYVYDYIGDCSYGVEAEGLAGVKVWLCQYTVQARYPVTSKAFFDWLANYTDAISPRKKELANRVIYHAADWEREYPLAVIDYLAGMTDRLLTRVYREITT